jgi:ADP-dependent NAD(P)H-hydrate dehydratase
MHPPIDASAGRLWPEPPCPLPARDRQAHKGSFGRALIVGGSRGMAGAVALAGMASVSGGAGLTTLAVPDRILDTVASFCPAYMVRGLADDAEGVIAGQAIAQVLELASGAAAFGLGPGLGSGLQVRQVVTQLYADLSVAGVIDADGLNALARLSLSAWAHPAAARILTPHPGEFERLCGVAAGDRREQIAAAQRLVDRQQVVLVLKGAETVVFRPGAESWVNPTGTPALATGGSGDVLTGLITALLCQGLEPWQAACLGVYVHGLAGELGESAQGGPALPPQRLIDWLPAALQRVIEPQRRHW